jgi:hypothetical protein
MPVTTPSPRAAQFWTYAAIGLALTAFLVLHVVEPFGEAMARPMSAYALGRHEPVWQLALVATAVAMLVPGTRSGFTARMSASATGLTLAGIGMLLVALFPTDPWYPWERLPTPIGTVHLIGVFVSLFAFSVSVIANRDRALRSLGRLYLVVFAVGLTALIGFVMVGREPRFIGLTERALMVIALAWTGRFVSVVDPGLRRSSLL